jgi:hypothetical protein
MVASHRGDVTARRPTFSVEVITLLVSHVERALRFYVDQVGFTLDVDYSPNEAFRVVQLTPPARAARSRSVMDSPTRPSVHFATSISSSRNSRPRGAACSIVGWKLVRFGTMRSLEPGTEVYHLRSTPHAQTMPASPISPLATAGCYRNGATATYDLVWKLGDVDQAWRRINSQEEIEADRRSSVLSSRTPIVNLHHSH